MDQKYMRPGLSFAMGKAIEEAGEFLAALGKTQRWGFYSTNPELGPESEINANWIAREMSDLRDALDNLERHMTPQMMARYCPACAENDPSPAPAEGRTK